MMTTKYTILTAMLAAGIGFGLQAGENCEGKEGCDKTKTAVSAACDSTKVAAAACEGKGECDAKVAKKSDAKAAKLQKVSLNVSGLECNVSCSQFKETVAKLDGVVESSACAVSKKATIAYDAQKLKKAKLIAAIKKAGYGIESEEVLFNVSGLKCGSCAGKVSKALASLDGVVNNEVCHKSKKAKIAFNPEKLSAEKIMAAIDSTGFKAEQ